MRIFINNIHQEGHNAGMKAPDDIVNILKSINSKVVNHPGRNKGKNSKLRLIFGIIWEIRCVIYLLELLFISIRYRNNSLIVIQFPQPYTGIIEKALFKYILKACGYFSQRTTLLIHDILSLRFGFNPYPDIEVINSAKFAIVHTNKMSSWLRANGCQTELIILEAFDYLCNVDGESVPSYSEKVKIAIAGNLSVEKSGYIGQLKSIDIGTASFQLFGKLTDELKVTGEQTFYNGVFAPDDPGILNAHFGLVWDGDNIETCSGFLGKYLEYNAPHKLSLYLTLGIPVIIWDKAATAELIEKNNAGILVSSLHNIKEELKKLDESKYLDMVAGANKLKKRMREGEFLLNAIHTIKKENLK